MIHRSFILFSCDYNFNVTVFYFNCETSSNFLFAIILILDSLVSFLDNSKRNLDHDRLSSRYNCVIHRSFTPPLVITILIPDNLFLSGISYSNITSPRRASRSSFFHLDIRRRRRRRGRSGRRLQEGRERYSRSRKKDTRKGKGGSDD